MFSKEDPQKSFFDPDQICGNLIEEDSFYHTLHKLGPAIISDEDFKSMYCEDNGRPSVPPAIMAKILLLQRYDDVSDREAARRVKFDVGWKHALNVQINWEGIHHSGLAHFRARLLAHDMEGIVFDKLNQLAARLGLIGADELHAIDSSHILGAAQVKDTYQLIRDAMAEVIEGIKAMGQEELLEVFDEGEKEKYHSKEKADIDWSKKPQRRDQLQVLVGDACRLLEVTKEEELPEDTEARQAVGLLEKILRQDISFPQQKDVDSFQGPGHEEETDPGTDTPGEESETKTEEKASREKKDSQKNEEEKDSQKDEEESEGENTEETPEVRIKQGVSEERLISVMDPQMRHGRKSSSNRFNGYTGHVMMNLDAGWITDAPVTKASDGDGEVGTEPLEGTEEKTGYCPDQLVGDIAYGTADNRVDYDQVGVDLISPVPEAVNGHGKFSKDDFEIDLEAGEVRCPAGETTQKQYKARDHKDRRVKKFQFDGEVCQECELRDKCTTSKRGRSITLNYHEEKLQEDREYQESEEFEEKYNRRPLCEAKIREVMRTHGMRNSRYIGKEKTQMQMTWTAAVVNLKRLPKLIKEKGEEIKEQAGYVSESIKEGLLPKMIPI